jgi:hypothetical protein
VSALKEGLDVEPAPETRKLYETIRNAEVPAPAQGYPRLPPSLPTGEGVFCTEKLAHGVTYVAVTSIHEWRIRWGSADEAKPQRSDYEEYISQC